jgi:hypothetical protein
MKLSPNFTLDELTVSETAERLGIDNTPTNDALLNLRRLAKFLEDLRAVLGKPIKINSGYRSPALNKAINGSKTSQHCFGCAADIRVNGMTPDQVVQAVIAAKMPYDQVIREFDRWTHISIPNNKNDKPRNMALIIDKLGTRKYFR